MPEKRSLDAAILCPSCAGGTLCTPRKPFGGIWPYGRLTPGRFITQRLLQRIAVYRRPLHPMRAFIWVLDCWLSAAATWVARAYCTHTLLPSAPTPVVARLGVTEERVDSGVLQTSAGSMGMRS